MYQMPQTGSMWRLKKQNLNIPIKLICINGIKVESKTRANDHFYNRYKGLLETARWKTEQLIHFSSDFGFEFIIILKYYQAEACIATQM